MGKGKCVVDWQGIQTLCSVSVPVMKNSNSTVDKSEQRCRAGPEPLPTVLCSSVNFKGCECVLIRSREVLQMLVGQ